MVPSVRRFVSGIGLAVTLATVPTPAAAQQQDSARVAVDPAAVVEDRTSQMVAGGIFGGLIGMFSGAAVGYGLERVASSSCYDYCGLAGIVFGGFIGETAGMAFGVHAGNDRRGSYVAAFTGPLAVALATIAAGAVLADANVPAGIVLLGVPVAQLVTSIHGERISMPKPLPAPPPPN